MVATELLLAAARGGLPGGAGCLFRRLGQVGLRRFTKAAPVARTWPPGSRCSAPGAATGSAN